MQTPFTRSHTLKWLHNIARWFNDMYWFVRHNTINRYHWLDCRTPNFNYKYGWMDRSDLMFIACFNLLKMFIEQEDWKMCYDFEGPEPVLTEDGEFAKQEWEILMEQRRVGKEMLSLYEWWTSGRQKNEAAAHALWEDAFFGWKETYGKNYVELVGPEDEATQKRKDLWLAAMNKNDEDDQKNFERLVAIKGHLWT